MPLKRIQIFRCVSRDSMLLSLKLSAAATALLLLSIYFMRKKSANI